jgi:hypothetical protein
VCRAQGASDDATTTMARARFKEGVEYFDKGQFELARAAFLQAYALKKHPAVLLNLAWSCVKSGHVVEGERYFKQFLSEGSEITDKQRADANDGLNQAHAKLGRIEIAGAPAGTEVSVDGENQGATPLADPVYVEAGAHAVKLRAPDGATDTENVTATAGERTLVRFARGGAPAQGAVAAATPPAATAPASATPEATPPPIAPPAEPEKAAPAPEAAVTPMPTPSTSQGDQGSMSIVPFVVGGVLIVAGASVAVVMKLQRDTAQHNADVTGSSISSHEQAAGISPQTCTSTKQNPLPSEFVAACATWQQDNSYVNEDATIANIAAGVAGAAAVGTLIYGIVYATHSHGSAPRAAVTPIVGPSFGGLSLSGSF